METLREASKIADIEWPEGAKLTVRRAPISFPDLRLKVNSVDRWFSLDGTVSIDGKTQLKINQILDKLKDRVGNFIHLEGSEYVLITNKLLKQLEILEDVSSKKKDDMLWPDMTIWFIVAYDIWNFTYTYNNLPTHTWYCGVALLLAPTFANALWNKGGWIQNRANTLATWCMFAQVFPLFQVDGIFSTLPVLYKYTGASTGMELSKLTLEQMNAAGAYPVAQGVMSILAVVANVICISVIIKRAVEQKKNPYKNEIFAGTRDYDQAMDRA